MKRVPALLINKVPLQISNERTRPNKISVVAVQNRINL